MVPYEKTKIVVIGMGFLMQYISPCYWNFIGTGDIASQMAATTADPNGLEEKSKRVRFPVQLGGTPELLQKMEPDIILFTLPTTLAAGVAKQDVAPYYAYLRERGQDLPDFYAFTPKPVGKDYAGILGNDVAIANIIPNMFSKLKDTDISKEGRTLVALAEDCAAWNDEKIRRIMDFFSPLGPVVLVPPKKQYALLATFSAGRVITDILLTASEILKVPVEDLSSCVRACFGKEWNFTAPRTEGYLPVSEEAVEEKYRTICRVLANGWIKGVVQGSEKEHISKYMVTNATLPLYDLRVHILQAEDRASVERDMRKHANKGGVFESACIAYTRDVAGPLKAFLRKAAADEIDAGACDRFEAELAGMAEALYASVIHHSRELEQSMETAELRPEHHAALFGFMTKRCVQRFGEEGRKSVLEIASRYGQERGRRMALRCIRNGEPLDMFNYLAYGEWRAVPGEADNRVVTFNPEYTTHSLKCPWCEGWRKHDLLEYGCLYCLAVDHGVVSGFNPELSIEINALQSMGDPVCEFVWTGSGIRNDEEKKAVDEKKKSLTEQCSKNFRYHTGHLYHVFAEELQKRFGEEGEDACQAALFDYRRTYGSAYEFPLIGNYDTID